ncbi:DMT family transporter [Arhodomonas aquaeolei]|uniref:DMT family transporter n=1 Tax=Arhodomonas aquaeolei TaxID=2369 RepID=UPI00035DE7B2|nr:DMT family transporter [Arhodomonas aquaeolei]
MPGARTGDGRDGASLRGAALVATAAGLWSTTSIVARLAFTAGALPPLVLGSVRLLLVTPLFLVAIAVLRGRRGIVPARAAWPFITGLGLAQAAYQGLYLTAVSWVGAGLATLVTLCSAPVITAVLAGVVLGEPLTRRTAEGMVGAITGTVLVVAFGETITAGPMLWWGVAASLAAGLVYALFTLLSRRAGHYCHPLQSACFGFAVGGIALAPAAAWSASAAAPLTVTGLAAVVYITLVPTFVGYIAFFQGMRVTPATASTIIVTLEPLVVAVLAWALLGEALGPWGMAGAVLLTASVLRVTGVGRRR